MTDEKRIRLLLELELPTAERRFSATVRDDQRSTTHTFESALDLVGWLEARTGADTGKGLR